MYKKFLRRLNCFVQQYFTYIVSSQKLAWYDGNPEKYYTEIRSIKTVLVNK